MGVGVDICMEPSLICRKLPLLFLETGRLDALAQALGSKIQAHLGESWTSETGPENQAGDGIGAVL